MKECYDGLLKDVNIKLMIQNIQHFAYNTVMLTVKIHSLIPIPRLLVAPYFSATSKKSLVEDVGV